MQGETELLQKNRTKCEIEALRGADRARGSEVATRRTMIICVFVFDRQKLGVIVHDACIVNDPKVMLTGRLWSHLEKSAKSK
jgi:hypothetical protein